MPRLVFHIILNHADSEPESFIDRPHPISISLGQIIINRNQMHPAPGKGIEIDRQRGNESLTFPCRHLSYHAPMKNYSSQYLNIKVPHIYFSLRRLPDNGKGFGENFLKNLVSYYFQFLFYLFFLLRRRNFP